MTMLYATNRADDCLRPCIATVLQIPPAEVPDPRIDRRLAAGDEPLQIATDAWEQLARWLDGRGLRLVVHTGALPVDRDRWIGVCRPRSDASATERVIGMAAWANHVPGTELVGFSDHSLVMSHDRVLHDPAIRVPAPPGLRVRGWTLTDVTYGVTFDTKERNDA